MVTARQLAAWKRLCEAASPEPWTVRKAGTDRDDTPWYDVFIALPPDGYPATRRRADAELMAAARTALPALIAEVERLRRDT